MTETKRAAAILLVAFSMVVAGWGSEVKRIDAQWIAAPGNPIQDTNVAYFSKQLNLERVPDHFVVHVSADNRFQLHVNGRRAGEGPARGDVHHWRYETFDLAPYLHTGQNTISAVVWNYGVLAPMAQMSARTGFLLFAEDASQAGVNSGPEWLVRREPGRGVLAADQSLGYFAGNTPEVMDGTKIDWNWDGDQPGQGWEKAEPIGRAGLRGMQDSPTPWQLVKDELPAMEYREQSGGKIVRVTGLGGSAPADLSQPVTIPAHSEVAILMDNGVLTTGYPELRLSGGENATVDVTYSEVLYDAKREKGNRNEVNGRQILGLLDRIVADGKSRAYSPLWWRCWRYIEFRVKTGGQALTIEGFKSYFSAYPFEARAEFKSDDPELERIWDVGWRTARLCAHETYMDTPYWEQLQYVGDTRIQALISYAVSGDDRLARQAMRAYFDSLQPEGLTQSRYPSALTQIIPPFSLLWVGMLHDYWICRDDPALVRELLQGTRGVLDWFLARQRTDGLLGLIDWWPFVDWSPPVFQGGVPPQETDGGSSALTLQFIEALRDASELEHEFGERDRAARYASEAKRAAAALMHESWDPQAGLLADTPAKKHFSQQANALAVWLDVVPKPQQQAVMKRVLASKEGTQVTVEGKTVPAMSQASYYFRFYVARAMVHARLGDEYIAQLEPWRKMLAMGLTTWAETPEPTRSDSHAWSAHPTLDLEQVVAGIGAGSPGFKTAEIAPHLGTLHQVSASMATPQGEVRVSYELSGNEWNARIELPGEMRGRFIWRGKTQALHAGAQEIHFAK